MVVVLTTITALVGAILGSVYELTKLPIEMANNKAQEEAIKEVAPNYDNIPSEESYQIDINGNLVTIFPAKQNGEPVGAAVKASTKNGFGGEITVIVGFEQDGTIRNYRVLSHAETPGLGAKMDEWFRTDKNRQSIIGKHPQKNNLTVSKDGGEIDAITASTITSRAFLEVLRTAYAAYSNNTTVDTFTGSTTSKVSHTTTNTEEDNQ